MLVDPMQAFKQGQLRGKVNSPVSSVGAAIKGILADARTKGLLQTKQNLATQGAIDQAEATQPFELAKMERQSELDTNKATGISDATLQNKIDVATSQAGAQGTQARMTDTAQYKRQQQETEGYTFENEAQPFEKKLQDGSIVVRVDKYDGKKWYKDWKNLSRTSMFNIFGDDTDIPENPPRSDGSIVGGQTVLPQKLSEAQILAMQARIDAAKRTGDVATLEGMKQDLSAQGININRFSF